VKAPYSRPGHDLPGANTVMADILRVTPANAFATINEICDRVGHHQRSIPPLIHMSVARGYMRPGRNRHTVPQLFQLTQVGVLVKNALGDG
jgi:hypothetical protein